MEKVKGAAKGKRGTCLEMGGRQIPRLFKWSSLINWSPDIVQRQCPEEELGRTV